MLLQPAPAAGRDEQMRLLVNILFFLAIWLLCVVAGNKGAIAALVVVLVHLVISERRTDDLRMMGFLLFTGLLIDGTLQQVGFFTFTVSGFPIPFWLMVIWLGLAITPYHSLAWLKYRPLLSVLFGALGGPLAYWAGARLDAASFNWPLIYSLPLLALIWGMLWPAVMLFSVFRGKGCDVKQDLMITHER
jgi:hypothetical protein